MASVRRNMVVMMVAMAAAAALQSTIAFPDFCPPDSEGQVYPYWSRCFDPAVYFTEEYKLMTMSRSGVLAPEYDEANSTNYMRLQEASKGATYKLTYRTKEIRSFVAEADDVIFVNTQTGRALAWREEGEGELFLVEASSDVSSPALLQFVNDKYNVHPLPCPALLEARCRVYFIVDFTASGHGLSPYKENGVTYFKRGSDTGLPLLLVRATTGDSALADHAASYSQVQLPASA